MATEHVSPIHSVSQSGAEEQINDLVEPTNSMMQKMAMSESEGENKEDKNDQGGYRFDKPEHIAALQLQRQQMWQWMKREGTNLLDLTRISLPVCLFEPRSFLERMTTNWDYMDLLMSAASCTDPADRMRFVVAFAISGMCRQVSFHKPFNPILGETYQSKYSNGVEVYCEQISHHPPVSSWQVQEPTRKFMFHGNGNWSAGIKGNSVKGRQTGINTVEFPQDGSKITYELVGITVKGVLWGQRSIKYGGGMVFKDEKNSLVCEVQVDPQPHQTLFQAWFRGKKAAGYKPDQVKGVLKRLEVKGVLKRLDVGNEVVLDHCTGNWLQKLEWEKGVKSIKTSNSKRLWDIKTSRLSEQLPVDNPLDSDCRHRKDLVFLKADDHAKAQEWKLKLEEVQRGDRKQRKDGGGYEH
eukprot:gene6341-2966_t